MYACTYICKMAVLFNLCTCTVSYTHVTSIINTPLIYPLSPSIPSFPPSFPPSLSPLSLPPSHFLKDFFILLRARFLHPVEELATGRVLEFQQEDPPCGALRHLEKLCVTWEDDEVLFRDTETVEWNRDKGWN